MSPSKCCVSSKVAQSMLSSRFHYLAGDLIRPIVRLCPSSIKGNLRVETEEAAGQVVASGWKGDQTTELQNRLGRRSYV